MRALMTHSGSSMWLHATPRKFDTRTEWSDSVCQHFVPLEIETSGSGPFYNTAANETLGCIQISELITSAQRVRRTRALAERSDQAQYKFSVQLSGRSQIAQDGRTTILDPGDWGFYDTSRPYEIWVDPGAHFLVLQIPALALASWESRMRSRVAMRYGSCSGIARVAMDTLRSLVAQGATLAPDEAFDVSTTVLQLLALSVGRHADDSGVSRQDEVRQGQLRVILQYVHQNLHDSELSATSLAQHFRISRRYLYKLFSTRRLSPADYILGTRLERCRELLADAACVRQIGELAHAHGFADASALSHAFRRRYGVSPSDWRSTAVSTTKNRQGR